MTRLLLKAKRPWRDRIWFYRPGTFDMKFKPWGAGNDEYHWKTLVLGWVWTGQIVIATRPFGYDPDECWVKEDDWFICSQPIYDAKQHGWEY